MNQTEIKENVGKTAVEMMVKSSMKVGLGTGSTAIHAIRHIGSLLKQGILTDIHAVPTSFQSIIECETGGIPIYSLNSPEINGHLDLTIDGADEVNSDNQCIKGGGGALLLEKIVAYNSSAYAVVVDESKLVNHLGMAFPVPLEVVPEARLPVIRALEKRGLSVRLREAVRKVGPVITEHGNILLDVLFPGVANPVDWEHTFAQIPGVVENGFFTRINPTVFVGTADGIVEVKKPCL
jgi:ribose 5-phosphate isomerase A